MVPLLLWENQVCLPHLRGGWDDDPLDWTLSG